MKKFCWKKNNYYDDKSVAFVELDEMWSYIGTKKKKCWIWIAHDRERKRVIDFELGSRGYKTGLRLWERIKKLNVVKFASDDWAAYQQFIPQDRHLIGKQYTENIEGFNSNYRLFLKRLNRRTKCYSKSKEMLKASLNLVINKFNITYSS